MPSLPQLTKPAASGILLAPGSPERSARPMDQQGAQVAIATFTEAEQAITAAAGPLLGYEPEPGGELAAILEALPITDRAVALNGAMPSICPRRRQSSLPR